MTTAPANQQIALARKLLTIADQLVADRMVQISDEAIRAIKAEIKVERLRIGEDDRLIDYEASCLIETITELAYARSEQDKKRESRAVMYINTLTCFMRSDLAAAERAHREAAS
jgi:hypothetical protein